MKTLFTLLTLVSLSLSSFAQDSYEDLMKRSRRARTVSTIMVSTGPVIAAGGIGTLIYGLVKNEIGDGEEIYDNQGNFIGYEDKKYTTQIVVGAAGALVGLGIALGSIAFSSKADDLRREARKVKLKTSTDRINIPGLGNGFANSRIRQYKVSLVIPLGR